MRLPLRALLVLVVVPFLALACSSQPADTDQAFERPADADLLGQAPTGDVVEQVLQGELLHVDTDAATITIRAGGAETVFAFTADTEVTGAVSRPQGLAGREGADVSVTYRVGSNGLEALKIHVQ